MLVILGTCYYCVVPYSNRALHNYTPDKNPTGNKVQTTMDGPVVLLTLLPLGSTPDIKDGLMKLKTDNQCANLANIETEYVDRSLYIFIGMVKLHIEAICEK